MARATLDINTPLSSICPFLLLLENISYEQKNCLYKLLWEVGVNGDTHSNSSVYLKEYLQIFFTGV